MTPEVGRRLAAIPRLDPKNAELCQMTCKICNHAATFFDVVDFNKCASLYSFGPSGVPVQYYRCDYCRFIFSPFFDDWEAEDFSRFIYNEDYVKVDPEYSSIRPIRLADVMAARLTRYKSARILDYGAGGGAFAERMNAAGFPHVESYDPFSLPKRPSGKFDLITCFEVLEHTPDPAAALADMRSFLNDEGGCIILGELLQPPDIERIRASWWYIAPRNGHVSAFADRTLAVLARRFGLIFHRGGPHAFRLGLGPFADAANIFGTPLLSTELGAPTNVGAVQGWHGVEQNPRARFRWTAVDTVAWQIELPPGQDWTVQVRIPFTSEIRPDFARESLLKIGHSQVTSSVQGRCIIGEAVAQNGGLLDVTLKTPALKSPAALRGSRDQRELGLAICLIE